MLATTRKDGRPQMSPVAVVVDDAGQVALSTRETDIKVKNLRRDPHLSLCLMSDGFVGEWGQVEGTAEIVEQLEALPLLEDYYRRVAGEHPDWVDYRRSMVADRRGLVRFVVGRLGPTVSG